MTEYDSEVNSVMNDGTLTVFLNGDIDHHNARAVRGKIDTKMFIMRPAELVIDLSQVSFMDSSGLGLILGRYSRAKELGIDFRVVNPTPQIRRILDLAGTDRIIVIDYSEIKRSEKVK